MNQKLFYLILEILADMYIPLMCLLILITCGKSTGVAYDKFSPIKTGKFRWIFLDFSLFLGMLTIGILIMLIDSTFGIWENFGLDYSTHTAIALAAVTFLVYTKPAPSSFLSGLAIWSGISFLVYTLLMIILGYHSFYDILSTSLVTFPAYYGAIFYHHRNI